MAIMTHCKRGHERTDENQYIAPNGSSYCKECRAMAKNRYRATKKGQLAEKRSALANINRHPSKQKARSVVMIALRNGTLTKPEKCEARWGLVECWGRIEAHHKDYSKPLEVKWLCMGHHRKVHNG